MHVDQGEHTDALIETLAELLEIVRCCGKKTAASVCPVAGVRGTCAALPWPPVLAVPAHDLHILLWVEPDAVRSPHLTAPTTRIYAQSNNWVVFRHAYKTNSNLSYPHYVTASLLLDCQ